MSSKTEVLKQTWLYLKVDLYDSLSGHGQGHGDPLRRHGQDWR